MINKSLIDKSKYNHFVLKNGVKVLTVSDSTLDKCSAAVSVFIGSRDEPKDTHGLAHFLEHMLFMGTKNYPGENEFMDFINKYNGSTNAYTATETTVYYYDITPDGFDESLSMFSDFFTNPLFIKDTVEREISAVNHEYLNGLYRDSRRNYSMYIHTCKKNAYLAKFSTGNYETLRKEDIWDQVKAFWSEYYSSEKMCLVICGNEEPEKLAEYAKKFDNIPKSTGVTNQKEKITSGIIKEEYLNRIIKIKPIKEQKTLNIRVELPPGIMHFKKNPYHYIEHIFTRSDVLGFNTHLKDEGLAFSSEFSIDYHDTFTIVIMEINLSDKGATKIKYILKYLQEYLKNMVLSEDKYKMLKETNYSIFQYLPKKDPIDITESLVAFMQYYPIEHVLDHEYIFEDFDKNLLEDIKTRISDVSKWLVFYSTVEGEFDMKENFYGIEYTLGEQVFVDLDDRNYILYEDIKFIKNSEKKSELLENAFEGGKLIYHFNDSYGEPKAYANCLLVFNNFENRRVELYFNIVKSIDLFYKNYEDEVTGYMINVDADICSQGINIKIDGFSVGLSKVLKLFFDSMFKDQSNLRNEIIKEEIKTDYLEDVYASPYQKSFVALQSLIFPGVDILPEEKIKTLEKINGNLKIEKKFYFELFVCGNIEYEETLKMFNDIKLNQEEAISRNPLKLTISGNNKEIQLKHEVNNACTIAYNMGKASNYKDAIIAKFIIQVFGEMFFDQLRTKEELGYIVFANNNTSLEHEFIYFVVQSTKDCEFLEKRILKFISEMKEVFEKMDSETFEQHRSSLISSLEETHKNLHDYNSYIWRKYLNGINALDYIKNMSEMAKKIKKEEMIENKTMDVPFVVKVRSNKN